MKRTCNRCRALQENECLLGHQIQKISKKTAIPGVARIEYKPLQECLKPKTYEDLCQAQKWVQAVSFATKWGDIQ